MIKFLLIGLILVHTTFQTEVVPDGPLVESSSHIEAKKYFKNKEWKNHKKHKSSEEWKEEYEYKKKRYDEEGKPLGKKHSNDKHKKYLKEEKYQKRSALVASPTVIEKAELVTSKPIDMMHDVDVNSVPRPSNPQSEVLFPAKKDFYLEMKELDLSIPPNPNNTVLMARYIVHNVDWAAMATVTTRSGAKHQPFANVLSMSDGPKGKGSGVPFFYITPMDLSTQDLIKENKASITVTLAQTDYCRTKTLDPEDPRCARVILSGKVKRVKPDTAEEAFAKEAIFSRHPAMETWPKDHEFYIAKLKIGHIVILDQFGGPRYLDVEQYLHPQV